MSSAIKSLAAFAADASNDGANAPATEAAIIGLVQEVFDQLVSQGVRGLAVCGVAEGDGVSHIAANLAAALGRAGVSTLLVDADLRMHRQFAPVLGLTPSLPGLTQLLTTSGVDPDTTIQFNVRPGLSVLPAGEPVANGADELSKSRFGELMDRWLREFEFVVVDTPPANQTPDTLRIARLTGYAVVVVRRDETFVDDLSLFIEELRDQGVTIAGAILNQG